MLSLKHILVAIDFSPISIVALRHALGIARRYHSNVSLLHVIDTSVYGAAGPDGIAADTECASRDAERIEAGLRADGSLEGIKLDIEVCVGPVWTTIAEAIEEKRSAALVLGTHGRTGLRKLALGSVAECAFREAPCPVLTVGPKVLQSKSSGAEAKHFLVPTDLSPQSLEALPYGTSLARATGGEVTLLYVLKARKSSMAHAVRSECQRIGISPLPQAEPGSAAVHFISYLISTQSFADRPEISPLRYLACTRNRMRGVGVQKIAKRARLSARWQRHQRLGRSVTEACYLHWNWKQQPSRAAFALHRW